MESSSEVELPAVNGSVAGSIPASPAKPFVDALNLLWRHTKAGREIVALADRLMWEGILPNELAVNLNPGSDEFIRLRAPDDPAP